MLLLHACNNSSKRRGLIMKFPMASIVATTVLLASALVSAQTAADINFNTTYQTIRGFGTSTAWQPVLNSTQANNLYGTGPGQVGFTILRSRIDPSSTTGGSNWATERSNAQQAQSINSQVIVFATPWTPPAVWKSNGSVDDGTLNTSDYDNFANYLNAFIAYEKAGGVNLYAISVQNEPDFLPSYESCGYSGAQMDAWIAQEGGKINTKLMAPESDSFNLDESDPFLNDANAVGHVAIVAGHTYGVNPFYYTNAKNKGKDVWMTETTYNNANGAAQPSISDAIAAAVLYHQSMAVAQYNAYIYWWTPLMLNGNSPNLDAYALGQYSKFVRPGYVMTGANNNPTSGVYVTSYKGNNNYVIVAVNSNSNASSISFPITGATLTSVTPYQTSISNQLAELSAVNVSNDSFTYSLPGQSITTFVGTGTTGSPSFTLGDSASSLSVLQGGSATDTISVTPENGFSGSVTFTATGLPSGVTASFSPTSSTTSSVLTLAASSTATAGGPVTVTITGTSGSTTATTTVALTVATKPASGFTLTPSASTLSVKQGASGTDTITVTDTGGFTGTVSFTATGMPSGVTASFSPASSASSSVLTLTASSTATLGAFTVTITGTSGSTTASTTITLSVGSSGGGSACTVDYKISPQNSSAFGAAVIIINNGSTALSGWSLTWSFANGQTIASSWNGAVSQSGANVTVSEQAGQSWENIPAGGSYSGFGFNGTWNGTTNAIPAAFSLNGTACTVN